MKNERQYRREKAPVLQRVRDAEEVVWLNPGKVPFAVCKEDLPVSGEEVDDAEARLQRFAPLIMKLFPETQENLGIIESDFTEIPAMQALLREKYHCSLPGRLLLKRDDQLPVAGSVKARGGIYEVLKHAEDLAVEQGLLQPAENYAKLAEPESRAFFGQYRIQVGSTGNLGISIGMMGAALGFQVTVHMSADARQWKKDLLRSRGVEVLEYASDYSTAVKRGRELSQNDPKSYFVDDENSKTLFLGYAAAAGRLAVQLKERKIPVDESHPLFVYLPCGVGGAPGGITFGLKQVFGDAVHCFFVEPTQAPCMLIGMASGRNHEICVQDLGLTGKTLADGLAVGRPSGFVGGLMKPLLSGEFTVQDAGLYAFMKDLMTSEHIFLEPSACAAFQGCVKSDSREIQEYLRCCHLQDCMDQAVHIAWATGGSLVPEDIRAEYMNGCS